MEETFGGSHWNLSSDLDVNGIVSFPGQSWALDVNDTHSLDIFLLFALLNYVDQVLSLTRLTNHNHGLIFSDIFRLQIYRIINIDLLETFKMLEIPHSWHCGIIAWSTGNHWQVVSKVDLAQFFEIWAKLYFALHSDFILIKSLERLWRLFEDFGIVVDRDQSAFVAQFLFDLLDFLDWKLPDFIVFGLEKAVSVLLEGYFLGSYVDLAFFGWKSNQNGLLPCWGIKLVWIILIDQHYAPLWVFVQVGLHDPERFEDWVAFVFQFSHKLGHDLCVSLAAESYIGQILVFDLGMIVNDSIVNQENFLVLVIVRVTVPFVDLTACRPSCMSDTNCWVNRLLIELLNESLNTIKTRRRITLFSKLTEHFLDFVILLGEGNDSCTVIASVFEQFDPITQ